jgi:hypothetical protein
MYVLKAVHKALQEFTTTFFITSGLLRERPKLKTIINEFSHKREVRLPDELR